jgi:acetyl-CoA C-acetyltransferase
MMEEVVIVGARRTAVGTFKGGLSNVRAPQLGAVCIRQLLADANLDPSAVDEVCVARRI